MQVAGQTPLSLASLSRHEKAVRILLDKGIDPTCPAIHEVRRRTNTASVMNHSLSSQKPRDQERGSIDHEMSNEFKQRLLAWTACTGNLLPVQSIRDRGPDPDLTNLERPDNFILRYAADGRQESADGGGQGSNCETPTRCDTAHWPTQFSTKVLKTPRLLPTGL